MIILVHIGHRWHPDICKYASCVFEW